MTAASRAPAKPDDDAASTLQKLVAEFARRGHRPAVVSFAGEHANEWTYAALAERIERLSRGLEARGVGAGTRVALWAPNSPEWIATYFGTVCAGATIVPLDQQAAAASAAEWLAHSEATLLVTTKARRTALAATGGVLPETIVLDGEPSERDSWQALLARDDGTAGATESISSRGDPNAVAALLYTSGTTGKPKAVPLTHRNLASNAAALRNARLVDENDRVLVPLPFHHTYPLTVGVLTVLGSGAAVVLPTGVSGPEIGYASRAGGATALLAVPRLCEALWESIRGAVAKRGPFAQRVFAALLRASIAIRRATGLHVGKLLFGGVHKQLGPKLRIIGCGGAKLEPDLAWRLEGLGWTVLTGYGLTETSPVVTFNEHRQMKLGTEGRPLAGVEVTIAGEPGKPGEVLVRGPNVFAGYWRNPEATATAFTEDGRFRTGDLGELDADGFLRIVGRSKELIVLPDGKKIVPEALEKIYAASPLVREIAILELDGRIVALLVPNDDVVRERGAIREDTLFRETLGDLAAGLPGYQRIADYRITQTPLPRTQLGKLKRHLLPDLYRGAASGERRAGEAAPLDAADAELLRGAEHRGVWQWLVERHPDHSITLDTSPQLDLKIDSLGWLALTLDIEQRFGVALTGDAVSRILSVRDLLREIAAAPPAEPRSRPAPWSPPGTAARALGALLHALLRPLVRLGFRLRVEGLEHLPETGPLVITPNHTSYLDPLVVAAALPWKRLRDTYWAGWVGIMFKGPLTRLVSRAAQVFPVDPDRDLAGAVETACTLLRNGHSVVWFPEGRRSPDGRLEPFQAGVALLLREGAAAVPVAIRGAFEAWPRGRRAPRLKPVQLTFGEPLTFTAHATCDGTSEREDTERTRAVLENAVRALLEGRKPVVALEERDT